VGGATAGGVSLQRGNCGARREANTTHVDAIDYRARVARRCDAIERELERLGRKRTASRRRVHRLAA